MESAVIVIGILTYLLCVDNVTSTDTVEEYCNAEVFTATCQSGHVVMMTSARYGRMELGRCVTTDFGFLGCERDVRHLMDSHCSGRQSCSVRVADQMFENITECHRDFKSYLEAGFRCLPVAAATQNNCRIQRNMRLTTNSAYIANIVAEETGCGTGSFPWIVEARPGQHINFTLYDFFPQVVGCANPEVGADMWMRRERDTLTVGCNHNNDITWSITCNDNQWSGTIGNCSSGGTKVTSDNRSGLQRLLAFSFEWAVVIIAGVAVIISSFIFIIGYIILKRRHSPPSLPQSVPSATAPRPFQRESPKKVNLQSCDKIYEGSQEAIHTLNENEYSYVWDNTGQPYVHSHTAAGSGFQDTRCGTLQKRPLASTSHSGEATLSKNCPSSRQAVRSFDARSCPHNVESCEIEASSASPFKSFPPKASS